MWNACLIPTHVCAGLLSNWSLQTTHFLWDSNCCTPQLHGSSCCCQAAAPRGWETCCGPIQNWRSSPKRQVPPRHRLFLNTSSFSLNIGHDRDRPTIMKWSQSAPDIVWRWRSKRATYMPTQYCKTCLHRVTCPIERIHFFYLVY